MKPLPLILALTLTSCAQVTQWTAPPDAATLAARDQRREQAQRRAAENEQRGQQEGLRNRFRRYSTGELKVMHARYSQLAGLNTSTDLGLNPAASAIWGNNDKRNTELLIDIERELLRRWKSGDAAAHLAHFE